MILRQFYHLGKYVMWLAKAFSRPEKYGIYYKETLRQIEEIGIGSLKIVLLISLFIGAVTSVQLSYQFGEGLIPTYYIGYALRDMVIIELAPTITSLVLAGKIGSSIAAEVGGMRQKEIIDAMEIMGVNTEGYIVLPKILAGFFSTPLLIILAAGLSIASGFFAGTTFGNMTPGDFTKGLSSFYDSYTVFIMIVKSFFFGFIIITVSAYHGYFVKGGSRELGKAGTDAVVYSNILILVFDYLIAQLMMG
jgi:phospholipid/cholesterol/gamma-HCH transport system permease protein